MLSKTISPSSMGRAEYAFREAFDRLKQNKPCVLKKGTLVSQNNVAKEAGCDPSALRKSRYPSLIAEIQRWTQEHEFSATPSPRQMVLAQRGRNRTLKVKIDAVKAERDQALSLLVEADAKIMELMIENASLQARLTPTNISPFRSKQPRTTD